MKLRHAIKLIALLVFAGSILANEVKHFSVIDLEYYNNIDIKYRDSLYLF